MKNLDENNLKGPLPFEMKFLGALNNLEFRANVITGAIPPEFGDLKSLIYFDLRQNLVEGTVPESIFMLPELRKLFLLRNSKLSGSIPSSIQRGSAPTLCSLT